VGILKKHDTAIRICTPIAVIILANICNLGDFLHSRGGIFNTLVTVGYFAFWIAMFFSTSRLTAKFTIAVAALSFAFAVLLTLDVLTKTDAFGAGFVSFPFIAPLYGAIVFFSKSTSAIPACLTLLIIGTLWLTTSVVAYKKNPTHNQ